MIWFQTLNSFLQIVKLYLYRRGSPLLDWLIDWLIDACMHGVGVRTFLGVFIFFDFSFLSSFFLLELGLEWREVGSGHIWPGQFIYFGFHSFYPYLSLFLFIFILWFFFFSPFFLFGMRGFGLVRFGLVWFGWVRLVVGWVRALNGTDRKHHKSYDY